MEYRFLCTLKISKMRSIQGVVIFRHWHCWCDVFHRSWTEQREITILKRGWSGLRLRSMSENSDCDGNAWVRVTTDPSQGNTQGTLSHIVFFFFFFWGGFLRGKL